MHQPDIMVEYAGQIGRTIDQLAQLLRLNDDPTSGTQVIDLVGLDRHIELTGALIFTVDVKVGDRLLNRLQVGHTQALQGVVLIGPAGAAVFFSMSDAGGAKAAIAP